MFHHLIELISKTAKLQPEEIELCEQYFEPMKGTKNTILEEQHKIPNYLYFVSSGFMRLFYYDDEGDEQTTFFCSPNNFIASFLSFVNQIKAAENVECITDCEFFRIKHANLKKLIAESENFKNFSLIIFEQALSSSALRANDLATLNAEQRYKKLIDQQPELLQHIPLQYIASFLGIKPESLSRIRRQIIS